MMNPWLLLGVGVLWLASLAAVGWKANEIGHETEKAAWLTRDNEALTAANATIQRLNDEARATEKAHTQRLADIAANNVKETQDAEARTRRAVAGARALVLRQQPACQGAGPSPAGQAAPAPGAGDGQAGCELPSATVRDLFQLVGDADRDVLQLAACQAVILSDRKESP